ncbi:MAG: FtsQ-type POTRA domain-containing protein [Acidimicrobiales bacterium]
MRRHSPLAGLRPPADTVAPPRPAPTGRRSPAPRAPGPAPVTSRPPPAGRGPGVAAGIDPRIAARRDAVRHGEGRRRARRIAVVAGTVVTVAAAAGMTRSPALDLDAVEVVGATRTPTEVVLATVTDAGVVRGTAMTDLDVAVAEDALAELPWVLDVSVRRVWPGTVRIDLRERVAAAAVTTADGVVLVAADGTVLDDTALDDTALDDTVLDDIVLVTEVPDPPAPGGVVGEATRPLLAVAAAVPTTLRPMVAAVAPGTAGGVDLVLAASAGVPDGVRVALGAAADPGAAFVAVATVLDQVDLTCLASIDVRVPSAPVLTRGPACP